MSGPKAERRVPGQFDKRNPTNFPLVPIRMSADALITEAGMAIVFTHRKARHD